MALRPIAKIGDSVLRKKAKLVPKNKIHTMEMRTLIKDMQETVQASNGIGLAAPQISVLKQIIVIDSSYKVESDLDRQYRQVLINPRVTEVGTNTESFWEECLSVPHLKGFVSRPNSITVEYFDQDANECSLRLENFMATVFQHEIDHLNGKLYIDYIEGLPNII